MRKLSRGEYLGRTLRRREIAGLTLTLTYYPSGQFYPWHVHESPTLFLLLAGQHRDEDRLQSFGQPPLSVVFHPTAGPHTTTIGPGGLVGLNLEMAHTELDRYHLRLRDLPVNHRLLDSPEARLLGLRLTASIFETGEAATSEVDTAVLELLACLLPEATKPDPKPLWLPRAKEYLWAHVPDGVGLSDLATEIGVHPVYCARAFRKAVGCTVMSYVRILRLLAAGQFILDDGISLAEAAYRAGFADQAHLTRLCTHLLGFAPGRLRQLRQIWRPTSP
jgi:AraC family transcriptional regulator